MAHIYSTNISAFPLAKNRDNNRESNLLYEQNIANIVNQIIDTEAFIVTSNIELLFEEGQSAGKLKLPQNSSLQVSLGGRLFTITSGDYDLELLSGVEKGDSIYLSVQVFNGEIFGQDDGEVYKGLTITNGDEIPSTHTHLLHLATITNEGEVVIPETSYLKLNLKSFAPAIKIIDGKR